MKLQRRQSYLIMFSCGRTPVLLVTTPLVRISWFRWSCLRMYRKSSIRIAWGQFSLVIAQVPGIYGSKQTESAVGHLCYIISHLIGPLLLLL